MGDFSITFPVTLPEDWSFKLSDRRDNKNIVRIESIYQYYQLTVGNIVGIDQSYRMMHSLFYSLDMFFLLSDRNVDFSRKVVGMNNTFSGNTKIEAPFIYDGSAPRARLVGPPVELPGSTPAVALESLASKYIHQKRTHPASWSNKKQNALELFRTSKSTKIDNARFLILWSALECLAPKQSKLQNRVPIIDSFISLLYKENIYGNERDKIS